jgi:homocysteine S-methyltransferase
LEEQLNNIRDFLKNNVLVADGSAGTYISSLTGRSSVSCELFNISDPALVLRMHKQYVNAGAKLILTNTFGASIAGGSIGASFYNTAKIIEAGVRLANSAAGNEVFVAADIGPLPESSVGLEVLENEYRLITDTFLACGMKNFVFETFPSSVFPIKFARYIREREPEAFIIISFAVMPDGYSRQGVSGQRLVEEVKNAGCADAVGFNCCSGPTHLLNFAKTVDYGELFPVIMPNAGYPQRESDDTSHLDADITYSGSPEYFADKLSVAAPDGFRIIGGCCGTTPLHIELLSKSLAGAGKVASKYAEKAEKSVSLTTHENFFERALTSTNKKVIIVELDPPFNSDITKVMEATWTVKSVGVDAVTVADSPMARPRADSVTVAARLKRETGIEAIPHICCRDKNINAIKSALIAAHMEGLRNMLAVTGDPVSDTDRGSVKSVFNLNSEGLCRFVNSLNNDIFSGDEILCGCAFNVNARNIPVELSRLEKKLAGGASFVLTQPVFTPEAINAIVSARKTGAKIIAGILTPVSYKNAFFLANEMPGFSIPDEYLARFSPDMTREEGEEAGIAISAEIAEKIAAVTDGFYFIIPFNRVDVTKRLIEQLRARGIL